MSEFVVVFCASWIVIELFRFLERLDNRLSRVEERFKP